MRSLCSWFIYMLAQQMGNTTLARNGEKHVAQREASSWTLIHVNLDYSPDLVRRLSAGCRRAVILFTEPNEYHDTLPVIETICVDRSIDPTELCDLIGCDFTCAVYAPGQMAQLRARLWGSVR